MEQLKCPGCGAFIQIDKARAIAFYGWTVAEKTKIMKSAGDVGRRGIG